MTGIDYTTYAKLLDMANLSYLHTECGRFAAGSQKITSLGHIGALLP